MQPRVAIAVADSVAVAVGPAPATSPVAVRDASVAVLETVRSGLPTKWRPPFLVIEVGATANAADAVRARTAMTVANTVMSLRIPVPFQLELCVRPLARMARSPAAFVDVMTGRAPRSPP